MSILGEQLLSLVQKDEQLRARLVSEGTLFGGYNPEMEALHVANGYAVEELIDSHGWPTTESDGKSAVDAAWKIAMHAISMPQLQRKILRELQRAGELSVHAAMLEDRVLVLSGKKQKYGTQYDWNKKGELVPYPIEDAEHVDLRRSLVGLGDLHAETERMRRNADSEKDHPPADREAYIQGRIAWLIERGWIQSESEIDPAYLEF